MLRFAFNKVIFFNSPEEGHFEGHVGDFLAQTWVRYLLF